jgi:hypothetical protein
MGARCEGHGRQQAKHWGGGVRAVLHEWGIDARLRNTSVIPSNRLPVSSGNKQKSNGTFVHDLLAAATRSTLSTAFFELGCRPMLDAHRGATRYALIPIQGLSFIWASPYYKIIQTGARILFNQT